MPDVAFDDLEAAQTRRANRPRPPRRAGAPAEAAAIVAALVAPCSDDTSDKVGRYLAQLFPAKCPLHYCAMKGSKVESKVLTKDWHESHSTKRVSRVQEGVTETQIIVLSSDVEFVPDVQSVHVVCDDAVDVSAECEFVLQLDGGTDTTTTLKTKFDGGGTASTALSSKSPSGPAARSRA